jgi:hypothetical protein
VLPAFFGPSPQKPLVKLPDILRFGAVWTRLMLCALPCDAMERPVLFKAPWLRFGVSLGKVTPVIAPLARGPALTEPERCWGAPSGDPKKLEAFKIVL